MARPRFTTRTMRRSLLALAIILVVGGTGLLSYPFATNLWAARLQRGLTEELKQSAKAYRTGKIGTGDALTRMEIPKLGVDTIVVEGVTLAALRAGAGHYPNTALPGKDGNVAIAGHRTTYGRPFSDMDKLLPGDKVILTTPLGRHTYQIMHKPFVVDPHDWRVIKEFPKKGSYLTLTSCHPEGSAAYRIVVRAKLVRSRNLVEEVR